MENSIENMLWDFLIDNSIATDDELRLVTCINGYKEQTFFDILYARCGLRDLEQAYEEGFFVSLPLREYYGLGEYGKQSVPA